MAKFWANQGKWQTEYVSWNKSHVCIVPCLTNQSWVTVLLKAGKYYCMSQNFILQTRELCTSQQVSLLFSSHSSFHFFSLLILRSIPFFLDVEIIEIMRESCVLILLILYPYILDLTPKLFCQRLEQQKGNHLHFAIIFHLANCYVYTDTCIYIKII